MILLCGLGLVFLIATAQASMKEMKLYKEVYPDAIVKCIDCHVDTMPGKDDGNHKLNNYGKAAVVEAKKTGANGILTADMYKKLGRVEDFKKK
jgi:hypothetical protein